MAELMNRPDGFQCMQPVRIVPWTAQAFRVVLAEVVFGTVAHKSFIRTLLKIRQLYSEKIRDLWLRHTWMPLPVPLYLLGSSTGQLGWQGGSVCHWNTNGDVVCTRPISALKGYVIIASCLSSCQQCSPSQYVSGVNYCSCTACKDHWLHWGKNAKYYSSLSAGGWAEFPSKATTVGRRWVWGMGAK